MEKTIRVEVTVKVDDKEDCYCGLFCRFMNGGWCGLFEEVVHLDTLRMDYSPFGAPSTYKYFRCEKCVELSEKKIEKIIIDGGETFEGTLEQFKDSFFDNADVENIEAWCRRELSTYEIIFSNGEKING